MTVEELIALLRQFPSDMPVEINSAWDEYCSADVNDVVAVPLSHWNNGDPIPPHVLLTSQKPRNPR